MEALPPE
jgi:AraC-like DNA-binding protein